MRLTYFGGPSWEGGALPAHGRGQSALLFRLAVDAGTVVSYRALAEDIWPSDEPDDPRAALQSLVSRVRRALPSGLIEAAPGGYRLTLAREEIDLTHFQDRAAAARNPEEAEDALALWVAEPWIPEGFDWVLKDLLESYAAVRTLARRSDADTVDAKEAPVAASAPAAPPSHAGPLPAALTPLIGRRRELALIGDRLSDSRLVTILGPGGAGKTTLALEAARTHSSVLLVELAPASRGEVWSAIAGAVSRSIRLRETPALPDRERALDALVGRPVLIVVDNCEHVVDEAADVVLDILRAAPTARVLATSREPLGLPGEAFVEVGGLPAADAADLFARRLTAARGSGPADDEHAPAARIVERLDGLPLALELAAAKARTLTLSEIDAGLDDRFALLASAARGVDPRHRTLRALIDWSWETLDESERAALTALAVFPDGVGVADAVAVVAVFGTTAIAIEALLDKSLLRRTSGRYRMLETVREYGVDRLVGAGDLDRARRREAEVMADLAIAHDETLRGPDARRVIAWYDENDENLTSAARNALAVADPSTSARLLRGVLWAWFMRERFELLQPMAQEVADIADLTTEPMVVVEGLSLMVEAFRYAAHSAIDADATPVVDFAERAGAVITAAAAYSSDFAQALPPLLQTLERAVAMTPEDPAQWQRHVIIDDRAPEGTSIWAQGLLSAMRAAMAQNSGDTDTLGEASERALSRFRECGDPWGVAFAAQMRSEWLMLQGRVDEALAIADESADGLEGLTSVWDVIQQRSTGVIALLRQDRVEAAEGRVAEIERVARADGSARALRQASLVASALDIAREDGDAALRRIDSLSSAEMEDHPQARAWMLTRRAQAHILRGDLRAARVELAEAYSAARRSSDQPIVADAVITLAGWLAASDRPMEADAALRAAVGIRGGASQDPFARIARRMTDEAARRATPTGAPDDSDAPEMTLEQIAELLS